MNEFKIFENVEFGQIRTVQLNNEIYFVGKDVATALGYANARDAIVKHVDDMDKGVAKCDTLGGAQDLTVINESGLYALIFGSKLESAKRFKHWVTSEVLPSIRKHGLYAIDEVLANPDMLITALQELKAEREKTKQLQLETAIQKQQIAEMQPKVTYHDIVLQCPDLMTITQIAKDFGMSARQMNQLLSVKKIQYKQSGIWLLYQKYASMGYTSTKTYVHDGNDDQKHASLHTYWTQKGRLFLYELLKADGILPLIEREEQTRAS